MIWWYHGIAKLLNFNISAGCNGRCYNKLFSLERKYVNDHYHIGCLALAELGRRGLLLPERLPEGREIK